MATPAGTDVGPTPAEAAIARGRWQEALDLLTEAGHRAEPTPSELEQLARASYGHGDLEGAITAYERLHADRVAAGEHVAAAGAATSVAMHLMMDTGLMAPVRGWASRAERLLAGHGETAVHAWLAMVRTYERILSGDLEAAGHWARRAVDVGERQHAPAPVAIGRVAQARLEIFEGRVEEGLALLDEAAVATMSSELDPLTIGIVYCELICAMQGLAQYDRAEEWTDAMERWRRNHAVGAMHGRCRVHRAEILRLRGSCEQAEQEALHACEELRPWMRREYGWPLTELGTIRLRRGDLPGAEEAFLAAHQHGWDPQPGLALLRLAQGAPAEAALLIDEALDRPVHIPSKERPPQVALRRAPLLEAQAQIALAVGRTERARAAAGELTRIAEAFRSRALTASASLARGRVALADGDAGLAATECAAAVEAWGEVVAPFETSMARRELARALRAAGDEKAARRELRAAATALEGIGARAQARVARQALDTATDERPGEPPAAIAAPSARAAGAPTPPAGAGDAGARQVFRLDGDTRTVVFDGTSVLVRDLKGMRYLARLLAEPGREFHVLDLLGAEVGGRAGRAPPHGLTPSTDAGPLLDDEAREAYRRRLRDIEDDIEEATRCNDPERAALAEADRGYLVGELSRAVGLGGRTRVFGSSSERARASVTRAVRYALRRLTEHHPALGAHLGRTVTTGTYCSYTPDPRLPTGWEL